MDMTGKLERMVCVARCTQHGAAPIPQEGTFSVSRQVTDISGFSHGVGTCAMNQGACKLTVNVKNGIISEVLVEVIGCSGMTQSSAMAVEILPGRTLLEALNTDLVCDAINVAMRELFLNLAYGRSQTAFTSDGLPVGAALDDLSNGYSSMVGTHYGSAQKGPRYLNIAEGYVRNLALDAENRIIGYRYTNLNEMMVRIDHGEDPAKALEATTSDYGRFEEAVTVIDPRKD
ncbi:MAG: hypothetical protein LBL15_06845 [Oscillospiraceae bacterium]|jgi:NifU-like protein involved in Fe-S cluster formation|nr:hypothetical protein [Oscillospiraceae bacterium]